MAIALLTTKEVAERLGVTKCRVHQFVYKGRLKPQKVGTLLLFSEHEIEAFSRAPRPSGRPRKSA